MVQKRQPNWQDMQVARGKKEVRVFDETAKFILINFMFLASPQSNIESRNQ